MINGAKWMKGKYFWGQSVHWEWTQSRSERKEELSLRMVLELKVFNESFFKGKKQNMVQGWRQIKVGERITGNKKAKFGLYGRGRRWDALVEWHWNMCIIICEMNHQSRFDAWYRMLGTGALGWPRGMVWGGRWEGGSGWGTHVHPW